MTASERIREARSQNETRKTVELHAAQIQTEREAIIGQWVALGYTPEQAYNAALFGWTECEVCRTALVDPLFQGSDGMSVCDDCR